MQRETSERLSSGFSRNIGQGQDRKGSQVCPLTFTRIMRRDGIKTMTMTPTRLMVSRELVTDRLLCMLEQMRCGSAHQVLLHTIFFANVLSLAYPDTQTLRDLIQQAQALFMRGNCHLAEQRLGEAIRFWTSGQMHRVVAASA